MILAAAVLFSRIRQAPPLPPLEHPVLPQLYRSPSMGPALAEVRFGLRVKARPAGSPGEVTLPVPGDYTGQAVFNFRVQCDPPEALLGWVWEPRADGLNAVVRVSVAPPADGAFVSWSARALVPGEAVVRTQKRDFGPWRASVPVSPNLRRAVARGLAELRASVKDPSELPGGAAMWVARYRGGWSLGTGRGVSPSDGSDSLNRALTCAAILRAMHVPARVVSYVPILLGADARPLWLTEYRSTEGGWEMVDPAVGLREPVRNSMLVLRIPALAEEAGLLSAPLGISASPSLEVTDSGPALSDRLYQVYGWSALSRLMPVIRTRSHTTVALARQGKADWIDDAAFQAAFDKGPVNLALFVSGQPMLPGRPRGR